MVLIAIVGVTVLLGMLIRAKSEVRDGQAEQFAIASLIAIFIFGGLGGFSGPAYQGSPSSFDSAAGVSGDLGTALISFLVALGLVKSAVALTR